MHVADTGLITAHAGTNVVDPPITRLTFATTDAEMMKTRTLRRIVLGKSCFTRDFITSILTPPWRAQRADHGLAIAAALEGVEGANVLLNTRIRVRIVSSLSSLRPSISARLSSRRTTASSSTERALRAALRE